MEMDPVYLSMNDDQKHYCDGQFWFGAAIGVVVGMAITLIGTIFMV